MSIGAHQAANDHATKGRARAAAATEWAEENGAEAVEIAQLSIAHSLASIATLLAGGVVEIQVADVPALPDLEPAPREYVTVVPRQRMPKAGIYQVTPSGDCGLLLARLGDRA